MSNDVEDAPKTVAGPQGTQLHNKESRLTSRPRPAAAPAAQVHRTRAPPPTVTPPTPTYATRRRDGIFRHLERMISVGHTMDRAYRPWTACHRRRTANSCRVSCPSVHPCTVQLGARVGASRRGRRRRRSRCPVDLSCARVPLPFRFPCLVRRAFRLQPPHASESEPTVP